MSRTYTFVSRIVMLCMLLAYVFLSVSFADEEIRLIEDESMQAGTYPVYLSDVDPNGNEISKVIRVTVVFPNTVQNQETNEAIDASDFKSTINTVEAMTLDELIKMSKAKAWNILTGEKVLITNFVVEKKENHIFKITFSTEKGTSTTVNAIEFQDELLPYNRAQYKIEERYELNTKVISLIILVAALAPISIGFYLVKQIDTKINETYEYIYHSSNQEDK